MNSTKLIQTSYKNYPILLGLGFLTLPLGIGIFVLFYVYLQTKKSIWELHSASIVIHQNKKSTTILLPDLITVKTISSPTQTKYKLADLEIKTNKGVFVIKGIEKAELYAEVLQLAIDSLKAKQKPRIPPRDEEFSDLAVGGLDKMNDLVGLWQAGMISDEDFYKEQEKFKK